MSKSSELDQTVKLYILDCIDNNDYSQKVLATTAQKIAFVESCFNKEYGHEIALVGRQNAVMSWLQGLPSVLNIEFMNYKILELAEKWGSLPPNASEKQQDKILDNYWNFMAAKLCQLFDGYRIPVDPNKIVLECCHVDTCLPDYWSGHHLAHVQIPVYHGMKLSDIKKDLCNEVNMGAIGGSDDRTRDDSDDFEQWADAAILAISKIKPAKKYQKRFFLDLEKPIEDNDHYDSDSVYAFFVFTEL